MDLHWDVRQKGVVAFHISVRRTFMGWFDQGVHVVHGTRALLFEDGAFRGEIPEGHHDHKSLADRLGYRLGAAQLDVVLVQAGDLLVEHAYDRVESSDHYPLDVKLELRIQIHDPAAFFTHFVQSRQSVTAEMLRNDLLDSRTESACRVATKRFGVIALREAHGGRDLRLALEAELERELRDELRRNGLDLVALSRFSATSERIEKLQDRRVEVAFGEQELEQDEAERGLETKRRDWEEGERRVDRDFDHNRWRWDSDKDLVEAREKIHAWASMAELTRNKKVLTQADLHELQDQLSQQAADYRKSGVLRTEDMRQFDREINWRQIEDTMADELRQKGLDHDAEIGDRARKLVLDKLQIAQWAELTKHRMLQEAEVEALQIRIEMERLEQTADKDELVARTGQRLNRVFLEGKAEELGLQEGVAEVARRSAISALKHDIDVEVRSLELDRAKGERSDEELARALKHKVLVADFTREQTIKDAETAGEVRRQAIALRGDDWRDKHAEQRGLIDIAAYERERQIELEKKEDDNDLDTLAKLQKIKAEKEARRAEAKLKADREAAALKAAADKQAHTEKMEQAQVAGAQVQAEKVLDNESEVARLAAHKEMTADQLYASQNPDAAKHFFKNRAKAEVAQAKHSAEGERERAEAVLSERDRADAERKEKEAIERADRLARDASDRAERGDVRSFVSELHGKSMGANAGSQAALDASAAERLAAEQGFRAETREDMREGRGQLAGLASHKVDPTGGRSPAPPASSDVSVRVDVGGTTKCSQCASTLSGTPRFCPECGNKLA